MAHELVRKPFIETPHCTSQEHCTKCRDIVEGRPWRKSLVELFVLPEHKIDFPCPLNKPWTGNEQTQKFADLANSSTPTPMAQQVSQPAASRPTCGPCSRRGH